MRSHWIFVFFCLVVYARSSYLGNSELCRPWTCVKNKLGLSDSPPREQANEILRQLLPSGPWQNIVDDVLNVCYNVTKPRRYTDTCPGQAAMHCVVDQLINYCPEDSLRKNDVCAPLASLAGFKYMFSQSVYEDMERNLSQETRPDWYMKHYFSSKCCNLPEMLNSTLLNECRFDKFLKYYNHRPPPKVRVFLLPIDFVRNYTTPLLVTSAQTSGSKEFQVDPLSCCDLSGFINQSDIDECGFQLEWNSTSRLIINNNTRVQTTTTTTTTPTPTTESPSKRRVVKVVPVSCEQETCVFRGLNIISDSGAVDSHAFSKLLDNFTRDYPEWTKAKARVVTKCLRRPITDYEAECEINKVLACTFDVLSENCPHMKTGVDPCKHSHALVNDTVVCQVSTSKYGPKNRRRFCDFPRLVQYSALLSCGVPALTRIESAPDVSPASGYLKPKYALHRWLTYKPTCKQTTAASSCLMNKMDVLSKYKFLDHFKMKDKIRQFTNSHVEWNSQQQSYFNALMSIPRYRDHCTSQKKLLNVVDAMITTCPMMRRRGTVACNKFYNDLWLQSQKDSNRLDKVKTAHFEHMYLPHRPLISNTFRPPFSKSPYMPISLNSNLNIHPHTNRRESRKLGNKLTWGVFSPISTEIRLRQPDQLNITAFSQSHPMTTVTLPINQHLPPKTPENLLPMLRQRTSVHFTSHGKEASVAKDSTGK